MKIIGITGGTGAGKSELSAKLGQLGATVVDSDLISHRISKKGGAAFDEIVTSFGTDILDKTGEIDRKRLGKIVFENPDKLELLEKITHKHIFERMQQEIEACDTDAVVLDVPLLFQGNFPIKCDLTVAVIADEETRIKRIMNRDGITKDAAVARIKNQLSNDEYKALADVCFENNGGPEEIEKFARRLLGKL